MIGEGSRGLSAWNDLLDVIRRLTACPLPPNVKVGPSRGDGWVLLSDQTAVRYERVTGDERGPVGAQVKHRLRNLLRGTHAADRL